jgi:hypothetical protein
MDARLANPRLMALEARAAYTLDSTTESKGSKMTKDIKDISEKEFTKVYDEYQAGLGRPMPAVVHRQGRSIPGCVSTEASAAWKLK